MGIPPYWGDILLGLSIGRGPPVVCQSNMTALSGEAALFVMSAVRQSRQAMLTASYRDTALYGDAALLGRQITWT